MPLLPKPSEWLLAYAARSRQTSSLVRAVLHRTRTYPGVLLQILSPTELARRFPNIQCPFLFSVYQNEPSWLQEYFANKEGLAALTEVRGRLLGLGQSALADSNLFQLQNVLHAFWYAFCSAIAD